MTWSQKRQFIVISFLLIIILILVSIFILPKLQKRPTCFDGEQNQNEKGLDCGGLCQKLCPFEASPIKVRWAKALPVSDNFYNALAYVENQNLDAGLKNIAYQFKFYGEDNVLITEKNGQTHLSQGGSMAIFEPTIDLKGLRPLRTTFNFTEEQIFYKINPKLKVFFEVLEKKLIDLETSPKLEVILANEFGPDLKDLEIITILYDESGNTIGFSKTVINNFLKETKQRIFFTWPKPFEAPVSNIEILFRFNVFRI